MGNDEIAAIVHTTIEIDYTMKRLALADQVDFLQHIRSYLNARIAHKVGVQSGDTPSPHDVDIQT